MLKNIFWFISLCALLLIAGANGWNIPLKVAVVANAAVVLLEVARGAVALYKANKGE